MVALPEIRSFPFPSLPYSNEPPALLRKKFRARKRLTNLHRGRAQCRNAVTVSVIYRPGWKAARVINDYFAGWEPDLSAATDDEFADTFDELVGQAPQSREFGCQTEVEEVIFRAALSAKEGERSPCGTASEVPPDRYAKLPCRHTPRVRSLVRCLPEAKLTMRAYA